MSAWEISDDNGATWSTFEQAHLSPPSFEYAAAGTSFALIAAQSAAALTDAAAYAHGNTLIIRYDAVRRFYGRVISLPRYGSGDGGEHIEYRLADPWWFLEQITYMQTWRIYDTAGQELQNVNKSRAVLFQDADGNRATVGAQIENIIDWAIAKGAPLTKGVIDAGVALPFDERDNLTCADAINTCLRWMPDWVASIDHSTTPYPTLHCRARANLSASTIAFADAEGLDITPRYDLQVPGVHITYEKTHTVDVSGADRTYNTVEIDSAGDANAFNTIFAAFELEGSSVSFLTQKIVTEDFPQDGETENLNEKAFWKARLHALSDIADIDLTIHAATRTETGLPRILIEGAVQSWMSKTAATSVITAKADYVVRDANTNVVHQIKNQPISIEITVTDATTHTYRRLGSYESGESTPSGVAAELYAAWSVLHHEGRFVLHDAECPGTIMPGQLVRISGGRAEWIDMDAVVQSVEEHIDTGQTVIACGPPARLEADTLVALFRALRSRRYSWRRIARATGHRDGQGIELSGITPNRAAHGGLGQTRRLVVEATVGEGESDLDHDIDLDPSAIAFATPGDAAAQDIKPREIEILTRDISDALVARRAQALIGEPYGDADPVGGGGDPDPPADPAHHTTLGSDAKGAEAASTDTWTIGDLDGSSNPLGLRLWIQTRQAYYEAGNKKWYAYARRLTYATDGRLYSAGAETRIEIHAPVSLANEL